MILDPELVRLKLVAAALLSVGLFTGTYAAVANGSGPVRQNLARYTLFLEGKMRRMFVWSPGGPIVIGQMLALFALLTLRALVAFPLWYVAAGLVVAGPAFWLEHLRKKRVVAIEEQIDGFVSALANALKTTPSIGDAFGSVKGLVRDPLRQELELATKEMRLGASLDQALLLMANRVGSRQLDSALSAVLIGRKVGGNLPKILETTAQSLREMGRLEGVVRTKTAEGRAQLWILALFPFLIVAALNAVSPGYFDVLTEGLAGYALLTVACLCWVVSLLVARTILRVDV